MTDYTHTRSGRRPATLITLAAVWLVLALALVMLDASLWIVGLGALATLPALYDLVTARVSSLRLSDTDLSWQSGRRADSIALRELEAVRLDTRLDLSIKATLTLRGGTKQRLPLDVVPPAQEFDDALSARGIKVERHHFSLVG
ncbi:hypothetical protein [Pseudosulfitobacter koreensis]|uniref:PH domain-containing protein n=1 Tax=Pseudosulfitobacter koreensis TaxID=2968472 RepID=A0ABT1YZT9_9RHOB|nr:hypothetical protein [Pseudosulfitobacter koreense]MCR8826411.1 hypothetical protein [Pseudosulfitobacter koreense]